MTTQRVQPGVPTGGQFAPTTHAESDVELTAADSDAPAPGIIDAYRAELNAEIRKLTATVTLAEDAHRAAAGRREQLEVEFENGEWEQANPSADWGVAFEAQMAAEEAQIAAETALTTARTDLRNAQIELSELDEALSLDAPDDPHSYPA